MSNDTILYTVGEVAERFSLTVREGVGSFVYEVQSSITKESAQQ